MKTQIRKLPKSQVEISIEVPAEEFTKYIEKAISDLGQDLEVEGFRKGNAPREVIEREIGKEQILKTAAERAIKENYIKVVLENKLEVLGQPKIEILPPTTFQGFGLEQVNHIKSGGGFVFKAQVAIMPEIQLPDYKKIAASFQKREVFVKTEEIEDTLKWLQKSRAKFSQVEKEAQKGDFVEIEYNSPEIENGKIQKDNFFLGQGKLVEGFEEKLEGMKRGEEKTFTLKFPESHFQKNLAGKDINFKAKMTSVQKVEFPETDDQFAKSLGSFENLNSLKENISQGIKMEKEMAERERIRSEILEKTTKEISWEIPEILIESEKDRMVENLKNLANQRFKISFTDYLTKIQKSEKDLRESFLPEAEKRIKNSLVLREIAKKENIEVSPEEVKAGINKFLENYPDMKKAEELDPHTNEAQIPIRAKRSAPSGVGVDLEKLKSYYEEAIKNEKVLQLLEGLTLKP